MKGAIAAARRLTAPSASEERAADRAAAQAMELVKKEAARHPEIREVEFGGSYAKGTWLPGRADIDIFLRLDAGVDGKRFEEIAKKVGFGALKKFGPYARYSDHPFVEADMGGTKVNVVPCYLVSSGQWKSAADRTPFHTRFMLEGLDGQMRADTRLLKQFLWCGGIYGAEISRQGFSGYAAEVLVWNFGSFAGAVQAMSQARSGDVIGKSESAPEQGIAIMDPVDPKRNLASAVSAQSMGRLVLLCRAFAKRPGPAFFAPKRPALRPAALKRCAIVSFKVRQKSPDTAWGQLRRASGAVALQLGQAGWGVARHGAAAGYDSAGSACLYFLLESFEISPVRARDGPEFYGQADVDGFVSKNAKSAISMWIGADGRVRLLERRPEKSARGFLCSLLGAGLRRSGVPGGLAPDIRRGFRVSIGGAGLGRAARAAILERMSGDEAAFSSS